MLERKFFSGNWLQVFILTANLILNTIPSSEFPTESPAETSEGDYDLLTG